MGNPPYDPYGQQQPGYGPSTPPPQPGYGQQYPPPQQPPAYQATPPPAYPAQPAFPAAAQPQIPAQQPYGYAGGAYGVYAGWGSRVAAYLVDAIIIGLVPAIFYGIGISLSATSLEVDPTTGALTSTGGSAVGTLLILFGALLALAGGLWLIYQEGTTGQTIGKRLVNIRLISEQTSQPIGFGLAFVRKIAHILDGLPCYIGYFWPLFDAKKQTFADKVMNTVVVRSH
ncbi:RDD family protein [Actinocorallia sp. API 0066]|uniref:RDD family protein n=1 Tax=Actinocorallia sp. API 0066 TaxID=2896846 RepID=UPI001E4EB86D|nr:RDD family protein [Actinocorallia sp. API 0066]MCD0450601.1 RDD family protein [Actinocorallia sp. API 0066]